MPDYIDLKRRFVERPKYVPDELIAADISGKRLEWAQVLDSRFAVIVAPANYGKTTEMLQRAVHMRANGEAAIFVALRKVAVRNSLEKALDSDELTAFSAWSASPTRPLTVFLDSLDEVPAGKREDIAYLVRQVAEALQWPNMHVRWVISTRPAVLTPDVLARLSDVLVRTISAASVSVSVASTTVLAGVTTSRPILSGSGTEPEDLHLYSMVPLESRQAELYLKSRYSALGAAELLRIARDRGLAGLATSPGGLDILAAIDLVARPPESLTEVFRRVVTEVQCLQSQDLRIQDAGSPAPQAVTEAVQKLASASLVCQLPNIEVPQEKIGVTDGVLSARLIASSLLSESTLHQLLTSQVFIDVGHHQVKLYPDELPPFLAAERLSSLVQSGEQALKLIETFSWRFPTGEQGVYRKFLPLMGWLATLNQHCREEILERDPQAVAFFGDLRSGSMPPEAARTALRESIRMLAEQGDRLGRGYFNLTSDNYWQAGAAPLRPLLLELFKKYGDNDRVREALLNIAASARSEVLRQLVLDGSGGDYQQLLAKSMDVRYLLELGFDKDLAGLARALMVEDHASESIVALLMRRLAWSHLCGAELAELVHRQFDRGRSGFHISYALTAGVLDGASDAQLLAFARSIIVRAARLRDRPSRTGRPRGRSADRLIELATEVLASLVSRTSLNSHRRVALLCLVMQRLISDAFYGQSGLSEVRSALLENTPVRRAFLALLVRYAGQDQQLLWDGIYGRQSLCSISAADVAALASDPLSALVKVHEESLARSRAKSQSTPDDKDERLQLGTKVKEQLLGMLEQLRDGSATSGLAWTAGWLLQTNPRSRYGEVRIEILEREAGQEIAQAVRQGFAKVWRTRQPKFDENQPSTTFHITVAGLQGLHVEMQEGTNLPPLTDDEVRNALRYGAFEINGYPKWFWPLVQAYEAVAGQELLRMVQCAKAGPISMDHAEQLLTSLDEAPPSVQEKLAPLAWTFLQEHPGLRAHVVEKLLKAVILSTRAASRAKFEAIAWNKVAAAFDGQLPKDQEQASNVHDLRKRSVIWASSWLARYPSTFQRKLEGWFKRFPDEARAFIYELAAHLGEDHGAPLVRVAQASDDGMSMLGALYRWTLEAVRPEEDKVHSDGEVYAVGSRENAERLRDSLIPSIAAAKSERAYQVLEELRRSATGYRARYLRAVQFDMREEQAARPAVAQQRYGDFERSLTADVTDTTSFAMAVHSDLLAVKYDIERGEFSLRRFFSEMNVRRVRTDKDGWALEAEFQGLLASELNHHSRGRYSVTIESRTAEAKRRDVLCSKGDNFASIELKMSERWTLQDYVQALEKQLVGQYMRHRKATTGFLVVVLQRSKQWKDPDTRRKVGFDGLLAILRSKALQLEARDRRRYLRIVGIDATPPVNFRHVAKTVRRKATKKSAVRGNAASATKGVATKNARGAAGAAARRRSTTEEPAVRRTSSAKKRAVTVVSRRKAATHKRPAAAK